VKEADQPGHIDAAKCTALGLPPGRAYKDLKEVSVCVCVCVYSVCVCEYSI
jgi:hypothetical protein